MSAAEKTREPKENLKSKQKEWYLGVFDAMSDHLQYKTSNIITF